MQFYLADEVSNSEEVYEVCVDSGQKELMERIYKSIDDTKMIVNDIVIGKANFLMMAYYLLDLREMLEDISRDEDFINMTSSEGSLQCLADVLQAIYYFARRCKDSSRILLLYQSNQLVVEITKRFEELAACLSRMLKANATIAPSIEVQIKQTQSKLSAALFYAEPEHERIAKEISQGIASGEADGSYATSILHHISTHLNMHLYEAGELKQELEDDLDAARIEGRESDLSLLQALHALLDSAILPDVTKLASEDLPAYSADDLAIPSSFYCPITGQIMEDPVMLVEAGHTYQRSAIIEWFERGNTICPNTGKELESFEVVPNLMLRQNIEEFFDMKRNKTMLHAIHQIRSEANPAEVEEAVSRVKQLLDVHPKYKRLLVTLDGIRPLVAILKPAMQQLKEKIYRILFSIAALGDEYKASIIEAGAVPILLRMLQRNPSVNGGPVQLLWEISKSEAGRVAILAEKASVLVVATAFNLCTNDQKLQAEQLLYNLCEHDKSAIIQAASSGVFGPLVRELMSGNEALQLEMAGAICSLDLNETSMNSLVDAGVLQPLLNILQHGLAECKLEAAKALECLSNSDTNKVAIAKSGTLPVLVRALSSPVQDLVTQSVAILANLATDKQISVEIEHEGAVSWLVDMLQIDAITHGYALRTLDCMAKQNRTVRQSLAELRAVPRLYSLLRSEALSSSCRASVLNLVCHIAEDHQTRQAIVIQRNMVSFFVRLLEAGIPVDEREAVLGILSAMAKVDETKHTMVSEDSLLQISVDCLKSDRPKIKECAVVILSKLTDPILVDKSVQLNLARLGMIPLLIDVVKTGSERAKQHAAVIFGQLSMRTPFLTERQSLVKKFLAKLGFTKYKICKVHAGKCSSKGTLCLVESGAVPCLMDLIKDGQYQSDGRCRSAQRGIEALFTLVKSDEDMEKGIDYLMRNEILIPLVHLVGKNENATEKAVMMMERIFKCRKYRVAKYANFAKSSLCTTMANGNTEARKAAAVALMHLGIVPRTSTYMTG